MPRASSAESGGPWPGITVSGGSSRSSSIRPASVSRYAAGEVAKGNSTGDRWSPTMSSPSSRSRKPVPSGVCPTRGKLSTTNSPSATAVPRANGRSTRGGPLGKPADSADVVPVAVRDQQLPDRGAQLRGAAVDCGHLVRGDRRVDDERLGLADDQQRGGLPEERLESLPAGRRHGYDVNAAGRSARRYSTS